MDRFLVAMPDFDLGTAYMSKWSEPLIRHAKDRGMDVVKIKGPDVNRRVVLGKLEAVKPRLVCLNGHMGIGTLIAGTNFQQCWM
ncbi:MAG: hypothetical protein WC408_04010 [Candidatus Micrarchaeia archaeon]|jgi:hypothetical protein